MSFTSSYRTEGCFPGGSVGKESACNAGDVRDVNSIPGSERSPGEKKWQPTPVFLPGKSHGQRSLAGYSPWAPRSGHGLTTKVPCIKQRQANLSTCK